MDGLEPSAFQVVAGFVLLAALFVVRELASGALKEAGKELWVAAKRRRDPTRGLGNSDCQSRND